MIMQGEISKRYHAVRRDNYQDAHDGELVMADDQTGEVQWKDRTGEIKSITLGPHMISIQTLSPYKR